MFSVAQATYNPKLNAVAERRKRSFHAFKNAFRYAEYLTDRNKPVTISVPGEEIMRNYLYEIEYRKVID